MNTRTNIVLDDKLVAKAMKLAGVKTKKAAVEAALRAFVARPKIDYAGLLALEGSRLVADDYDPKEPYGVRAGWPAPAAREPVAGAAPPPPPRVAPPVAGKRPAKARQ